MPTPNGEPLSLKVRCWTSQARGAKFTKHMAVIYPDWSLQVPHDLDSERLAQAFGGWLSCLELETKTLPAARRWLDLTLRAVPPPIRLGNAGHWYVVREQGCCPTTGYDHPADAFEHARSLNHIGNTLVVDRKQLNDLVNALGAAHGVHDEVPLPEEAADLAADGLTHARKDVVRLWRAGVHPECVTDIRERLDITGRLPMSFYLAVLMRKPDLDWMRATLDRAGETNEPAQITTGGVVLDASGLMPLPEWLAWTETDDDLADPTLRARWLELGISRQVLLNLAGRGYTPEDVVALGAGIGRTPDGAARHLVSWLVCDVQPTIADLVDLHRSGRAPLWFAPSPVTLMRAMDTLTIGRKRSHVDRLQVAFLLAVCGNVPDTVTAYRAGRTWRDDPLTEENTA